MTKRQLIRAGFILAGAIVLNGCGKQASDRVAGKSSLAAQPIASLARGELLTVAPAPR